MTALQRSEDGDNDSAGPCIVLFEMEVLPQCARAEGPVLAVALSLWKGSSLGRQDSDLTRQQSRWKLPDHNDDGSGVFRAFHQNGVGPVNSDLNVTSLTQQRPSEQGSPRASGGMPTMLH